MAASHQKLQDEIKSSERIFRQNMQQFAAGGQFDPAKFSFLNAAEKEKMEFFLRPYRALAEQKIDFSKETGTAWIAEINRDPKAQNSFHAIIQSYAESEKFFAELQEKYPKQTDAFKVNGRDLNDKEVTMNISVFLIQPVQRFPRYELLANGLKKNLEDQSKQLKSDERKAQFEIAAAKDDMKANQQNPKAWKVAHEAFKKATQKYLAAQQQQAVIQKQLTPTIAHCNEVKQSNVKLNESLRTEALTAADIYRNVFVQFIDRQIAANKGGEATPLLETVKYNVLTTKDFIKVKENFEILLKEKTVPSAIKKGIKEFMQDPVFKGALAQSVEVARRQKSPTAFEKRFDTVIENLDASIRFNEKAIKDAKLNLYAQAKDSSVIANIQKEVKPYQERLQKLNQLKSNLIANQKDKSACQTILAQAKKDNLLVPDRTMKSGEKIVKSPMSVRK